LHHNSREGATFCLVDAPDTAEAERVHREAHGEIAHAIIPVNLATVEGLLGRIGDPSAAPGAAAPAINAGLRAVMFTDIVGSTEMTARLGDSAALELVRAHDALVRRALEAYGGREVKHTGDGIMASFRGTPARLRRVFVFLGLGCFEPGPNHRALRESLLFADSRQRGRGVTARRISYRDRLPSRPRRGRGGSIAHLRILERIFEVNQRCAREPVYCALTEVEVTMSGFRVSFFKKVLGGNGHEVDVCQYSFETLANTRAEAEERAKKAFCEDPSHELDDPRGSLPGAASGFAFPNSCAHRDSRKTSCLSTVVRARLVIAAANLT